MLCYEKNSFIYINISFVFKYQLFMIQGRFALSSSDTQNTSIVHINKNICCEICEVDKWSRMRGDRQRCEEHKLMNCDKNEKYVEANILTKASLTHRGNQGTCL